MRRVAGAMTAFLLVGFSTIVAQAQEVSSIQIDRASVTILNAFHPIGSYVYTGPDVKITGDLRTGDGSVSPSCGYCVGGQSVRINGQFQSRSRGIVHVNGALGNFWILYGLTARSPDFVLPRRYSRVPFNVVIPATLTGVVKASVRDPFFDNFPEQVFESPLNMEGTVTLKLKFIGQYSPTGNPYYILLKTTYDFQQANSATN